MTTKTDEVKRIGKFVYNEIEKHIGRVIELEETEDSVILTNNDWPKRRAVFEVSCGSMYCYIDHWDYDRNEWEHHSEMKAYQFENKLVFLSGMLYGNLTD